MKLEKIKSFLVRWLALPVQNTPAAWRTFGISVLWWLKAVFLLYHISMGNFTLEALIKLLKLIL